MNNFYITLKILAIFFNIERLLVSFYKKICSYCSKFLLSSIQNDNLELNVSSGACILTFKRGSGVSIYSISVFLTSQPEKVTECLRRRLYRVKAPFSASKAITVWWNWMYLVLFSFLNIHFSKKFSSLENSVSQ